MEATIERDQKFSKSQILKQGPGLPIVFLHGFLGTAADWEAVCSHLPPCQCIGIDLPGHGQSPFTKNFSIDIPRFHLVGYSMGARLALRVPKEKIASLTLLSVHPGLKTEEEKKERLKKDTEWAELLLQLPIDEFLKRWYNQPIFQPFCPDLTMRKQQNVHNLSRALLHYSLAHQPFTPIEGALIGARDEKFLRLHKNPIVIPDAGHMIHLENPQAVAQIIREKL